MTHTLPIVGVLKRLALIIILAVAGFAQATPDMGSYLSGGTTCWSVRTWGAKGNGSTDDTVAIQSALSYFGVGGAGTAAGGCLYFPQGRYKVTNTLVYEGSVSTTIRLLGEVGWAPGSTGTRIEWWGPNGGTVLLMLGANQTSIEHLDIWPNAIAAGGSTYAQNGVWWDASNTVTQVAYNISSISRASNVVTATIPAHVITPSRIVKVAGVTDASFNGTFRVLYANDSTHVSWLQGGADGSSSSGTVTNYHSNPSNNIGMKHSMVAPTKAISSTITSVTGTNPITVTTSTLHMLRLTDTAIIRGVTDATYNGAWQVATIPTSTTATLIPIAASNTFAASGSGSSGGTILTDSVGVRLGHPDALTPQVSSFRGDDLYVQGDDLGTSVTGVKADVGGNVKDFVFNNLQSNGTRYGLSNFSSGTLDVYGYFGGLTTPDAAANLASVDFFSLVGQIHISGAETEGSNNRFFTSSGSSGVNNVHLDAISYQASAPTDDTVVLTYGTVMITNSTFTNTRTVTSVPLIESAGPLFGSAGSSINSHGNTYANAAVGGPSNAPGWIPVRDGSGNFFMQPGGYYPNKSLNVSSVGDFGTLSNGMSTPSSLYNTTTFAAVVAQQSGTAGVADAGFIRMGNTDAINFRNNANGANINGLTKTTADVVKVGGAAGIQPGGTTFSALGTPGNGVVNYCSDCTKATPCAGSGTGAIAKRINGAWDCN